MTRSALLVCWNAQQLGEKRKLNNQRIGQFSIVTPILPEVPGHSPRKYRNELGEQIFYNHMPATEICQKIGSDAFYNMVRFCVEREPVEKCISHFHMLRNSPLHNKNGSYQKTWNEYVKAGNFPLDHMRYSAPLNGKAKPLITHFLRYDRLSTDLPLLLENLGISDFALNVRAKSEYSLNRLISAGEVSKRQRERIYRAFQKTLEVTGIDWTE